MDTRGAFRDHGRSDRIYQGNATHASHLIVAGVIMVYVTPGVTYRDHGRSYHSTCYPWGNLS
jgi:hypothetical protein